MLIMRIIAGHYRGFSLATQRGRRLRPTANLVREAVFSVLGVLLNDKDILDLFAGTGAYGFEALSRNAGHVVFVDKDLGACSNMKITGQRLGVQGRIEIINMSAFRAVKYLLNRGAKFSLIFLDPPYCSGDIHQILGSEEFKGLLRDDGAIICESSARSAAISPPLGMVNFFSRKYGETMVNMFCFIGTDLRKLV